MYAFYLNETHYSDQLCTVPVINMKRLDISSQAELKWLFDSCQIDLKSLIFVDEVCSTHNSKSCQIACFLSSFIMVFYVLPLG